MSVQNLKLDARTLQVMKNFSTINPSLLVKQGSTLTTMAPLKTILAKAKVPAEFSSQFAIYDLSKFLSALSLFNDPTLEIQEKFVTIKNGGRKLNYTFADPASIITPPEKEINFPAAEITFTLTADAFKDVMKAMSVLGSTELAIVGNGSEISIQAIDVKDPSSSVYSAVVGTTDKTFTAHFKAENLKILPGDYIVGLSSAKISKFDGDSVTYYISLEATSSF